MINEDAHIRAALSARGIALKQVADACGISKGAVSQWFLSGPGWQPIPERHMATIQELLAKPPPVTTPVMAADPEPQLVMLQPFAVAGGTLPARPIASQEPARRRQPALSRAGRAPLRAPPPQPMHWGAPPFLGQEPPPRSPMHYPGHWPSAPVMPPPAPAYVSPVAGPQHVAVVAAHNRASLLGERRDVRSPPGDGEFPLGQFFGLTGPIRHEDLEAFEARLTLEATESGFAKSPELRQMIEALRTAVRRHNASFQIV